MIARLPWLLLFLAAAAAPADAGWPMQYGNAQHTALAGAPTQSLQQIHWQMPVDLHPQYSGTTLLIHYGSPLITGGNTVLVPVKVGVADTFRVEARRGSDGLPLWQLDTDYRLPPHNWIPCVAPTLAPRGRVYVPGAGGTLLWTDALDSAGVHAVHRVAFYGSGVYAANPAAFDTSLRICTPLTSDSRGTIYFGFMAIVPNPLGIESGIAAVDSMGRGRYVSVTQATGGLATQPILTGAPALSGDEQTLYVLFRAGTSWPAYLVALRTSDLGTNHVRLLVDPVSGQMAPLYANGTSSPMVGPDGRVYIGVIENPTGSNASRGWMLQFDAALDPAGAPGAFGWDVTPSVVPASAVPGYGGTSSYLLMTKYNFYAGRGTGENRIAVLDPGATQVDSYSGATVMREVMSILCPTPDPDAGAAYPNAVKEWCINTAVVDSFTHSVMAGAEDGKLYRWDLASGTFTETVVLTPGIGEAYTPTIAGPDGQVYAINNATLFAVGAGPLSVPSPGIAGGLALSIPRPNPFASTTSFQVLLDRQSVVIADVFDLAGRRVRVLHAGPLEAGAHALVWDGRDDTGAVRPPGVYLVRISDGVRSATRKVVLGR